MDRGALHPSQRIPRHQAQHKRLGRNPARHSAKSRDLPQSLGSLLQFEMTKIFLHDHGHRHAQGCAEILHRHGALFFAIRKQLDQAARQILCVAGAIKINRQFLALSHLSKIRNVRGNNGYSISASQMRYAAAAGG
jgi:hypothetical protein